MAGSSISFAYDDGHRRFGPSGSFRRVTVSWVSDSVTGAVSGTMEKVVGRLVKGVTVPAAAGLAPSASYGIAVTDEQAVDVLASCKKNLTGRSATATEEVYFFVLNQDVTPLSTVEHPTVCEKLTIAVTAAGNSKAGTIYLYYDPKQ